jgi:hypothetical protein
LNIEKQCPICGKIIGPVTLQESIAQPEIMMGRYAVHLRAEHPRFYRWSWWFRMSIVLIPVLGVTFILIFAQTGSLALLIVSILITVSLGFSLLKLNHAKV